MTHFACFMWKEIHSTCLLAFRDTLKAHKQKLPRKHHRAFLKITLGQVLLDKFSQRKKNTKGNKYKMDSQQTTLEFSFLLLREN